MKKKQIIAIALVCFILISTGLVGLRSAMMMNQLREKSTESAQKNLEQVLGIVKEKTSLPTTDYIGQIDIVGTIQNSSQMSGAITGDNQYNHSLYLDFIEQMEGDEKNKGIFLYVDSPGGTVYESDELYLRLMEYKEKTGRPIYAYFANQACSGAYYISMAADKIYANRNCWTGSIGVIISLMNYQKMLEKIGVSEIDITSGVNKTIGSGAHEMTEDQGKILQSLVDEAYEQFTAIVADGRKMDPETVKKLADGRIYSAQQAKDNKLIDEIMGLEEMKKTVADSVGSEDILFFQPAGDTQWMQLFSSLFGKGGIGDLFKTDSDIEAAREWLEQDESGVLMYYAR